jgi:hypothetical protein
MRFIITAQAAADSTANDKTDFDEELFKAYMRFNEEMHQAGVLVASEGLNPAARGARIAVADGRRYVVVGPFTESKELAGVSTFLRSVRLRRPFNGPFALRPDSGRTTFSTSAS